MPESVESPAEDAAAAAGQSLNTWLVNVVRSATRGESEAAITVDIDPPSLPFFGGANPFPYSRRQPVPLLPPPTRRGG